MLTHWRGSKVLAWEMSTVNERTARGYSYYVTDEQIRKHSRLTTRQKLTWLEDVNDFTNKVATDRARRLHRMFRRGEI